MLCGGGYWVPAQAALKGGGEGGRGLVAPSTLSPVSWGGGGVGYKVLPWSDLMIRVVRPWNSLLMWVGPGSPSLSYIHTRPIALSTLCTPQRPVYTANRWFLWTKKSRAPSPPHAPPPGTKKHFWPWLCKLTETSDGLWVKKVLNACPVTETCPKKGNFYQRYNSKENNLEQWNIYYLYLLKNVWSESE